MTTELVELADCICGAVVDQEECPYPTGRLSDPGPGRAVFQVVCTNPECGWQAIGFGADGARKAWNTRALASRAGGWLPIESAPRDGSLILVVGNNFGMPERGNHFAVAAFEHGGFWEQTDPDPEGEMSYLTHWQPLPEPPAAPEPVAVG